MVNNKQHKYDNGSFALQMIDDCLDCERALSRSHKSSGQVRLCVNDTAAGGGSTCRRSRPWPPGDGATAV